MLFHHSLRCLSDPPAVASSAYQDYFMPITLKPVDEWSYGKCHGKCIILSGTFLRIECASIYKELGILSVGVDDDFWVKG